MLKKILILMLTLGIVCCITTLSFADTINPTTFSATVAVGGTATVHKVVTISAGSPTSATLDVMFIIDTTGSMGTAIASAKSLVATLLSNLAAFGNLASGTGYYNDPDFNGVLSNLNTNSAVTTASINSATFTASGGGDTPEQDLAAIDQAANNASWRAGSNRFIIALGDASSHVPPSLATTITDLNAKNIHFIGIDFGALGSGLDGGQGLAGLASATGGAIYPSATDPAAISAAILSGIGTSFATYTNVTVGNLAAGLPGVSQSVVCTSAAAGGICSGASATGSYDRSVARTFEYDVTFTGLVAGTYDFPTFALVNGGTVATEADHIVVTGTTGVPEPTTLVLLSLGLLGLGFIKRTSVRA